MSKITKEELLKLAKISCISIQENEIKELVENLNSVLNYASSLQKVVKESKGLNEAQLIRTVNVTRSDTPAEYNSKIILDEAPNQEENYFVVPIIIKQSDFKI
jgi:aspartyl-tRNA(Asn)/glutamyl-tRNA(Gln) amidotransferase subunit C